MIWVDVQVGLCIRTTRVLLRRVVVKTFMLLCALLLAGLAQAQSKPQARFMPVLDGTVASDLGAVGRVNKAGLYDKGSCSGTLIRPDVVLTAGHCAGGINPLNTHMFVAGWNRGEYIAARKIIKQMPHPAYMIGGRHDPRFDVGLIFLDEPITEVAPIPLAPDTSDIVTLAGYHRDIPHLLSGRTDCPIERRDSKVMWIGCPVVSGNSGGPVLEADSDGNWLVTGVVSSTTGGGAIATRLPEWLYRALDDI